MMMDRRRFLGRTAALGCSLAASPLVTPVSFAALPGDARLVVIVLRGGMDGLGVVAPHGDPDFAALRGAVPLQGPGAMTDLDGFFALHGALSPLLPWWRAGDLGFVHAVSTPYRDKRSHFDGQDLLEAGIADLRGGLSRDGWLNRLLQVMPGATAETAWAIGNDPMFVASGAAPIKRWTPEADLALSPQALRLAEHIYADDSQMAAALAEAYALADGDGDGVALSPGTNMMAMMQADRQPGGGKHAAEQMAGFAAKRLRADSRIASFSINGWDTHARQDRLLARALDRLAASLAALKSGLGHEAWARTAVVAVTEFGRTARLNGTQGTDHGTGGAMILAGGAIRGGRVVADWPGLSEAALYDRRDLMPTRDLRAHLGWLLHGLFDVPRDAVERRIFPGLDMGPDPRLLP